MKIAVDIAFWILLVLIAGNTILDVVLLAVVPPRKRKRRHPAPTDWAFANINRVLDLFDAHRESREHPKRVIHTDRYKA